MLTDIRINPDNKLSGNIRIINYPFNYPSTWRLILFMYFLCSFSKFLRYFTTILYINTSISKIIVADLNVLSLGYTTATLRYPPSRPHYDFYDFILLSCPFSVIINRKRRHWYPDNYPDNLLSDKRISG